MRATPKSCAVASPPEDVKHIEFEEDGFTDGMYEGNPGNQGVYPSKYDEDEELGLIRIDLATISVVKKKFSWTPGDADTVIFTGGVSLRPRVQNPPSYFIRKARGVLQKSASDSLSRKGQ